MTNFDELETISKGSPLHYETINKLYNQDPSNFLVNLEKLSKSLIGFIISAEKQYEEGLFSDSIPNFTNALQICPLNKRALHNRCLAFFKSNKLKEALDDSESIIKYNQLWPRGYLLRCMVLLSQKKTDEVQKTLQTISKLQLTENDKQELSKINKMVDSVANSIHIYTQASKGIFWYKKSTNWYHILNELKNHNGKEAVGFTYSTKDKVEYKVQSEKEWELFLQNGGASKGYAIFDKNAPDVKVVPVEEQIEVKIELKLYNSILEESEFFSKKKNNEIIYRFMEKDLLYYFKEYNSSKNEFYVEFIQKTIINN